jgi:hypothetical protein
MAKHPLNAAPPDGVVPEVPKSDFDVSGSETEVNKSDQRARRREGATFAIQGLGEHYVPIDSYEGRHRYDPKFEWEPEEERRVVRKVRLPKTPDREC